MSITRDSNLPRVLILSRGVWDDSLGVSSTLTNIFADYDPEKLAHIYIETKYPRTKCCYRFFQISEYSLVRKLWRWGMKVGHGFDTRIDSRPEGLQTIAEREAAAMDYVRSHRSVVYSSLRELVWLFNGWKSKDLKQFIAQFDPEVIWLDGSPLPFMNRVYAYIMAKVRKPTSIFLQDDVYTYKSCSGGLWHLLRKHHLRRNVRKVVEKCSNVFVASPKMKREYDELFGVNSTFIAKSFTFDEKQFEPAEPHTPLRIVYMGQVIYGRIKTLMSITETMSSINKNGSRVQLSIYTNNPIPEECIQRMLSCGDVTVKGTVPYSEVPKVLAENDVVVFVETFDLRLNKVARLSFSTKISDYLRSGKCVLAVGPADLAPIEYFLEEDAAIVASNEAEIGDCLETLCRPGVVESYSAKAYACALRNHNRSKMDGIIYGKLKEIAREYYNK